MTNNSNPIPKILRPLGLPVLDELSIYFSSYMDKMSRDDGVFQVTKQHSFQLGNEGLIVPESVISFNSIHNHQIHRKIMTMLNTWENSLNGNDNRTGMISDLLIYMKNNEVFNEVYARLHSHLQGASREDFLLLFRNIWFAEYDAVVDANKKMNRNSEASSCGFEHVYIGQKRGGVVKGLHHWLRLFILERQARLKVMSKIKQMPSLPILALNFSWDNATKNYGTLLFGITFNLELLIFTAAFLLRGNRGSGIRFLLQNSPVNVTVFDSAFNANVLATAYFKY